MADSQLEHRPLRIFEGTTISEFLVPVVAEGQYERGAALAIRFAKAWHLPVRIVHVHQPSHPDVAEAPPVDETMRTLKAAHPAVTFDALELEDGNIGRAVARATTAESLLALATDHVSQWAGSDSVAEKITRAADGPILLFGPKCIETTVQGSVIVALDGSSRAEESLRYAAGLAKALDSMLWVVQVVDAATATHVKQLRSAGEQVSESAYLRSVADRLKAASVNVGWEIVHSDDPVAALTKLAHDRSAGMIVAATHGESGLPRKLFGSVCMGLVERGDVPVLVVKSGQAAEPELDPAK